jgi:hypothetical protein
MVYVSLMRQHRLPSTGLTAPTQVRLTGRRQDWKSGRSVFVSSVQCWKYDIHKVHIAVSICTSRCLWSCAFGGGYTANYTVSAYCRLNNKQGRLQVPVGRWLAGCMSQQLELPYLCIFCADFVKGFYLAREGLNSLVFIYENWNSPGYLVMTHILASLLPP